MAKAIFSNEQLCKTWVAVADAKGSRKDVVVKLMEVVGMEDTPENQKRMYNNVTQRCRSLAEHGLEFPELVSGHTGGSKIAKDLDSLKAILTPAPAVSDAE